LKILLHLETKNDIRNDIIINLKALDHEVYTIPNVNLYKLSYYDKFIHLILFYLKITNNYIKNRKLKLEEKNKKYQREQIYRQKFDLALIFRADTVSDEDLELYKKRSKKMVAYQWDGINRYENFHKKIDYFHKIYCFDPEDEKLPKIRFLPNFYFSHYATYINSPVLIDLIYIGYFYQSRYDLLKKLSNKFPNLNCHFILKSFNKQEIKLINASNFLIQQDNVLAYEELMKIQSQANVILDLKHEVHNGLSFRFFEGIVLQKKIITTNKSVINYDFYNSNNIFILDENNFNLVEEFLKTDYVVLDNKLIKKYSFENWFSIISN